MILIRIDLDLESASDDLFQNDINSTVNKTCSPWSEKLPTALVAPLVPYDVEKFIK